MLKKNKTKQMQNKKNPPDNFAYKETSAGGQIKLQ